MIATKQKDRSQSSLDYMRFTFEGSYVSLPFYVNIFDKQDNYFCCFRLKYKVK